MSFFSRKRAEPAPPPVDAVAALATALTNALATTMTIQTQQTQNYGAFLDRVGELAGKRAAQALGQRGGRKRAARVAEAKDCELCRDPMSTNITPEIIAKHREHQRAASAARIIRPRPENELN